MKRYLAVALLLWFFAPVFAAAQEKEQAQDKETQDGKGLTGDMIMEKVRENQYSETMDSVIQMTLIDRNGIVQVRRFRLQRRKNDVLIRFLDPPDIKDTGYLILENEEGEEQVYVYFPPPTDDYRQINVEDEDETRSFLGSDFDITDFQIRNPEESVNTYIETKEVSGIEVHIVESIPKDPDYKYKKIKTWVRSDYWLPLRIQFFNAEGDLVKDMKVRKFRTIEERKVASKTEMTNLPRDHKTILELEDVRFDINFPDQNFSIRRLTNP